MVTLEEALRPFAHFAAMWDAQPLNRGGDDHVIYGIHTGTEWEAHITLGDLRRARAALDDDPWPCDCGEVSDHKGGCPRGKR